MIRLLADFLAGLTAAQIAGLAGGRTRLAIVPAVPARSPGSSEAAAPAGGRSGRSRPGAAPPTPAEARGTLRGLGRRDEAVAYLDGLKLKAAALRELAGGLGLPTAGTKSQLVDRIVDATVGYRLSSAAVLDGTR